MRAVRFSDRYSKTGGTSAVQFDEFWFHGFLPNVTLSVSTPVEIQMLCVVGRLVGHEHKEPYLLTCSGSLSNAPVRVHSTTNHQQLP